MKNKGVKIREKKEELELVPRKENIKRICMLLKSSLGWLEVEGYISWWDIEITLSKVVETRCLVMMPFLVHFLGLLGWLLTKLCCGLVD